MKAMRIHRTGDLDGLQMDELPEPRPGPGQVRVRIRAASLNYRDLLIIKGLVQPQPAAAARAAVRRRR